MIPASLSSSVQYTAEETPPEAPQGPRSVDSLIDEYSLKYGVSAPVMKKVVYCESSNNPRAIGDGGYSRGLAQIHSKYWPEVTDEMAFDPEFAIEFLAKKLSTGEGHLWTCYRKWYS